MQKTSLEKLSEALQDRGKDAETQIMKSDLFLGLVEVRKQLAMTQGQVADQMGVAQSRVSNMETFCTGSLENVVKYAVAVGAVVKVHAPVVRVLESKQVFFKKSGRDVEPSKNIFYLNDGPLLRVAQ